MEWGHVCVYVYENVFHTPPAISTDLFTLFTLSSPSDDFGACGLEFLSCMQSTSCRALVEDLHRNFTSPSPSNPSGQDVCSTCKPGSIVFAPTGGNCQATSNFQSGKFVCQDNSVASGSGVITVTSSAVTVTSVTGGFRISSGGSRLPSNTDLKVFENGVLIQV